VASPSIRFTTKPRAPSRSASWFIKPRLLCSTNHGMSDRDSVRRRASASKRSGQRLSVCSDCGLSSVSPHFYYFRRNCGHIQSNAYWVLKGCRVRLLSHASESRSWQSGQA
jgi:hypothetical protein